MTVTITADIPNDPPTAVPGDNQSVRAGDFVFLNGGASFDDNTAAVDLGYSWTLTATPEGSTAALTGAATATPSFQTDEEGDYVVELVVTDELGATSDPVAVTISSDNQAPTAVAKVQSSIVIVGGTALFDGSGSTDPEGDALTYSWTLTAAPIGSSATLQGETGANPSLSPDLEGTYVAELTVSDLLGAGEPVSVEFVAMTPINFAEGNIVESSQIAEGLSAGQVTNPGNQQAFANFLKSASKQLLKGDVAKAIADLERAIERADGCARRGEVDGKGPGRDWITDWDAQKAVYNLLQASLAALQQ